MKKLYLFLILLFASQIAGAQLSTGLVAHWNFNGNVNDASGNGHNGTANNITYTQGKNGVANNAAVFNGTSSWVNVPHSDSFNISEYSICAVFKPTGFYPGLCQGNFILFRGSQYVSGGYGLQYNDNVYNSCSVSDTNKYIFLSEVGGSTWTASHWQTTSRIHTQQWYCVVATYDQTGANSGTVKVYVNGTLINTINLTGKLTNITAPMAIGKYINGGTQYPYWLNGVVDDIRLYKRVLSPTEVTSYCGTVSSPDTAVALVSLSDSIHCKPSTVVAGYNVNYNFGSGNVFTLQMSDATGSFSNPTVIGTNTASISGSITGTIPSATTLGNYKLRVVSSNPVKISGTKNITVNNTVALTASISANPGVNVAPLTPITFTATIPTGISNVSYQWVKNSAAISGATNSTYTGTSGVNLINGDKINVYVTSTQTCVLPSSTSSDTLTLAVGLSVNTVAQDGSISVFPNPNNGTFTIKGRVNAKTVQVQIINTVGQIVYQENTPSSKGLLNKTIQLNDLAAGVYRLQLQMGDKTKTIPISIQ